MSQKLRGQKTRCLICAALHLNPPITLLPSPPSTQATESFLTMQGQLYLKVSSYFWLTFNANLAPTIN